MTDFTTPEGCWDSENRQSPFSTVADPNEEGCENCDGDRDGVYCDDCREYLNIDKDCPECGSRNAPCYFICSQSPRSYSAEQERDDSNWNDSLSESAWMSEAVKQYERVHGEPYCS